MRAVRVLTATDRCLPRNVQIVYARIFGVRFFENLPECLLAACIQLVGIWLDCESSVGTVVLHKYRVSLSFTACSSRAKPSALAAAEVSGG
jgi:hypothetical protein